MSAVLCCSAHQALKGAPWVGSYSVVQCVRCLMGQPLYCSAAHAGMWGESWYVGREWLWGWLYPLRVTQQYHLASMPGGKLPGFPPLAFPTRISSFTSPQAIFPWSTAALVRGLLPVSAPSRGPASLSRVCTAMARTACFSFHLGCHRSAVSLSALNVSPPTQTIALMWG